MNRRRLVLLAGAVAVVVVVAGLAVWYFLAPAPFSMQVIQRPTDPPGTGENVVSIVGQRVVFLVAVAEGEELLGDSDGVGEGVEISASVPFDMADVDVHPTSIAPGQVAEVSVIPRAASVNETFTLTITGERFGLVRTETFGLEVVTGEDDLGPIAEEMRDRFVPWLSVNHPEVGVTEETEWTGTIVNPRILVVMHYIFFSEEWEMYLTWHVTIAPHDWTRIYLRHRFDETGPSHAFEISSVENQEEPRVIQVPDWV